MSRRKRETLLEGLDASLLDVVDHVLTKGIVLTGELVLGVADVDLVYLRLSAVLCAADRILGTSSEAMSRARLERTSAPFGRGVAGRRGTISAPSRPRRSAKRA